MPQLDTTIFFNQLFWFFTSFFCIYIYFTYLVIPKINFYNLVRFNIHVKISSLNNLFDIAPLQELLSNQSSNEFSLVRNYIFSILQFEYPYNLSNPSALVKFQTRNLLDNYNFALKINLLVKVPFFQSQN